MKKTIIIVLIQVILYVLHFIVFPTAFLKYFPTSNEATGLFLASTVIFTVAGMLVVTTNILSWFAGDAAYVILTFIYSNNAYGLGMRGIFEAESYNSSDRWTGILLIFIFLVIVQFISAGIITLIKKDF